MTTITNDPARNPRAMTKTLLTLTPAGIILYWAAVFSGAVVVEPLAPGYVDWFMAFPLADLWIAASALAGLVFLARNNARLASPFMAATGSALIFLALNATAYGFRTGLLFSLTIGEMVEITIKIYCFAAGVALVAASCRTENIPARGEPETVCTSSRPSRFL